MPAALAGLGWRSTALPLAGRSLPLHAMLSSAGIERRTGGGYDWHGRRRGGAEFALFQYTFAGEGRLSVGAGQHRPLPGTAMLLRFPDDNRYWLPPGGRWEFFYLCLHGREVMRAWSELIARAGPLLALPPDAPAVATAAAACRDALAGALASPWRASAAAYAVAMHLLDATAPAAGVGQPRHGAIARARACGERRCTEAIGVDDLAAAAGLSRHHFSRRFRASEGVTPAAWLRDLRLRAAMRLLRGGGLTVAEVARRTGFADAAYFCRAFRRQVGLSPGEYRGSGMY